MLLYIMQSRAHGEVEFRASRPGEYLFVGTHGRAAARQCCAGGHVDAGSALCAPRDGAQFEAYCRRWWAAYLRRRRTA